MVDLSGGLEEFTARAYARGVPARKVNSARLSTPLETCTDRA